MGAEVQKTATGVLVSLVLVGMLWLLPPTAVAQEDSGEAPLGDLARSLRKKPAAPKAVIDNDNFSKVMDEAERSRALRSSLLFSMDAGSKNFQVSTPDVTCSLSFSANASSLLSNPYAQKELPAADLAKLDGPATIDGDQLQISVYNGTGWNVREVTIGLTVVKQKDTAGASYYGGARLVPAVGKSDQEVDTSAEKRSDVTVLYHIKGEAAPFATTTFHTPLDVPIAPNQEWHWAIVRARGIPPQASSQSQPQQPGQADPNPQSQPPSPAQSRVGPNPSAN